MFHKNTEKLESLVGAGSHFKGDIETQGTIRIDGRVDGNVNADWVIVSDKGQVSGDVSARGIVAGGRIDGNLKAKEIVEIKSKGQVYGEIVTSKLTVSEGGIFDGRSTMRREEPKVIEFVGKDKAG